ncbi:hypothetical protein D3C77_652650 [compost metagenome]
MCHGRAACIRDIALLSRKFLGGVGVPISSGGEGGWASFSDYDPPKGLQYCRAR